MLASDAHDRRRRPFCLADGRKAAIEIVGEKEAEQLCSSGPGEWHATSRSRVKTPTLGPRSRARGSCESCAIWGRERTRGRKEKGLKSADSVRREGDALASHHAYEREAARAGREQADSLFRDRSDQGGGYHGHRHRGGRHGAGDPRRRGRRPGVRRARHVHPPDGAVGAGPRGEDLARLPWRRHVRDVPRRQLHQGRHHVLGAGVPARPPELPDPARARAEPRIVRRGRARRRAGRASRRETEAAEVRLRAGRRVHVRRHDLRGGGGDPSVAAGRAGDHGRDPVPDREGPRRPQPRHQGMVEGHRQGRGSARSEPRGAHVDGARHPWLGGCPLAHPRRGQRGRGRHRGELGAARPAHRGRGHRDSRLVHWAVHVHLLALHDRRLESSSRSSSRRAASGTSATPGGSPHRPERAHRAGAGEPRAFRFMVGDNSEIQVPE